MKSILKESFATKLYESQGKSEEKKIVIVMQKLGVGVVLVELFLSNF